MVWWILGIGLGLALLADSLVRASSVRMILPIFERSPMFQTPRNAPDPRAEVVEIPTTGGLTLSGCLFHRGETESRGVVIFCPEFGATKWSCMSYCEGLWEAGYDILAIDFRNSGDSAYQSDYSPIHWVTEFERDDVLAAVQFVRQHPELRERSIGLYGISRGAGAALLAGAVSSDIELVVSDSAFDLDPMMMHFTRRWYSLYIPEWLMRAIPTWHLKSSMAIVRRISQRRRGCRYASVIRTLRKAPTKTRFLMISGMADSFVNSGVAQELAVAAGDALDELWLVPKCKHNAARQLNPDVYDARVLQFLSAMSPFRQEAAPLQIAAS